MSELQILPQDRDEPWLLRRGFLLPARRLCNHRHGQKWGAQNSNPIGVRPLLLRAIRPRGSHHVRAGMPETNRRVRPLG